MEQDDSYIKRVMTMVKCSECGELYKRGGVDVLGHTDEIWFISLTCYTCFSKCLVAALMRVADDGVEAPPPASGRDVLGSQVLTPVGDAEVRDMTDFLSRFDGDFRGLFARDAGTSS